jgi:hypothetical protein
VIRIFRSGPHAHRNPLGHAALWPLFAGQVTWTDEPEQADLYLFAHIGNIREIPQLLVEDWRRRRRPIVLLSEEPLWDVTGGGEPLAAHSHVDTRFGLLPVHQLNHHTSDIFRFDRIPYHLLTHHQFASAYQYRFARNAVRSAADWRADFAARKEDILFPFLDRAEPPLQFDWPTADLEGLGAWRMELAAACGAGEERPAGFPRDTERDRYLERLTRLDGRARFLEALEPAHQPDYMTSNFFDAFACGSAPLYYASSHHRLHDLGLPAEAWVNLHGTAPEMAAGTEIRQFDAEAYAEAQTLLSAHFGNAGHWQQERERLGRAVMRALQEVLDAPAVPRPQPGQFAKPGARLTRFHNAHAGERCVLVCNGPSLNRMDLSGLRNETVIGLNKIYLGFECFGFEPDYLVAVNDKVIAQSAEAYADLTCTKFLTDRASRIVPADPKTFHMRTHGIEPRFSRDLTLGLHEGYTVTHVALQVAYFMGFKEVIIIGMDHRFESEGLPNTPLHMRGADPNHFSPDYFRDQTWDAPDLAQSEVSYRAARQAFEQDDRRILDATLGGACTVFPKVTYRKVCRL